MRFQVQIWTRVGYPMLGIPCGSTGPGLSMPEIKKLGINRVNRIEHPRMYFAGYHQCGPKCESLHVACRFSEYNSGLFFGLAYIRSYSRAVNRENPLVGINRINWFRLPDEQIRL